jgi:hypothetical protein
MCNLSGQGTNFYCCGNFRSLVGFYIVLSQNFNTASSIFLNFGDVQMVSNIVFISTDNYGNKITLSGFFLL